MKMEISDEKLRQIVRETLRELGAEAAPDLVRKVVREVIRRLQQKEPSALHAHDRRLPMIDSPAPPVVEKSRDASPQGY
jgi:hypothetical protein